MSAKDPSRPSAAAPSKDERLAKALRENLARRKALQRAKRAKDDGASAAAPTLEPPGSNDKKRS